MPFEIVNDLCMKAGWGVHPDPSCCAEQGKGSCADRHVDWANLNKNPFLSLLEHNASTRNPFLNGYISDWDVKKEVLRVEYYRGDVCGVFPWQYMTRCRVYYRQVYGNTMPTIIANTEAQIDGIFSELGDWFTTMFFLTFILSLG